MTRMIANTCQIFDERGHARQSPQVRLVSLGRRTGQQRLRDLLSLLACEFRFAARRPFAGQRSLPALFPRLLPTIGNLPRHPKTACYLRGGMSFVEECRSSFPAFFHLNMISCLRHAQTIDRRLLHVTNNLSLYYASLNNRCIFKNGKNSFSVWRFFRPSIGAGRFGIALNIENLHVAFPNRLAAKHFMDGHSPPVDGPAIVQVLQGQFDPANIFHIIRHNVQQVRVVS